MDRYGKIKEVVRLSMILRNLEIIKHRKVAYAISTVLLIVSLSVLVGWGLNLGLDFKGGTLMEVQFGKEVTKEAVEDVLSGSDLSSLLIQPSDENKVLVRYLSSDESANDRVLEKLTEIDNEVQQLRVDFIGASVSQQITQRAIEAVVVAMVAMLLYIAYTFRKVSEPVSSWKYGLGAIIALLHDAIIILGVFAVLGRFYGVEVGIPFVAAILTILGYSINDTIVVYDRVRENLIKYGKKEQFAQVVNRSLNETLVRSFNTSITVVFVLFAIIVFGGESVRYFAVALLIGIIVGTYSSIYIASSFLVSSYEAGRRNKSH